MELEPVQGTARVEVLPCLAGADEGVWVEMASVGSSDAPHLPPLSCLLWWERDEAHPSFTTAETTSAGFMLNYTISGYTDSFENTTSECFTLNYEYKQFRCLYGDFFLWTCG